MNRLVRGAGADLEEKLPSDDGPQSIVPTANVREVHPGRGMANGLTSVNVLSPDPQGSLLLKGAHQWWR